MTRLLLGLLAAFAVAVVVLALLLHRANGKGALCYLAGVMEAAARSIDIKIRWGGDFDRDGVLLEKGTFHDLPHFELDQP